MLRPLLPLLLPILHAYPKCPLWAQTGQESPLPQCYIRTGLAQISGCVSKRYSCLASGFIKGSQGNSFTKSFSRKSNAGSVINQSDLLSWGLNCPQTLHKNPIIQVPVFTIPPIPLLICPFNFSEIFPTTNPPPENPHITLDEFYAGNYPPTIDPTSHVQLDLNRLHLTAKT